MKYLLVFLVFYINLFSFDFIKYNEKEKSLLLNKSIYYDCKNKRQTYMNNPKHEYLRTNPDYIVYIPEKKGYGDNEHFLV